MKKTQLAIFTGNNPDLLKTVRVSFKGKEYWLLEQTPGLPPGRPLAYIHHCDDEGELLGKHVSSESFAHVRPDGINRFGTIIGQPEDLEIVSKRKGKQ
jgi:hypothetical protein